MTEENPLKKKIEKNIEKSKSFPQFYQYNYRIYFLNSYGVIVSLPSKEFLQKLDSLNSYFENRPEPEKKKLVRENLSMFASVMEDTEYFPKLEVMYESNAVTCVKYSGYSPKEDYQEINERVIKTLRGETLNNEEENSEWRTKRNDWLSEFARKIRDKLRKELTGSD